MPVKDKVNSTDDRVKKKPDRVKKTNTDVEYSKKRKRTSVKTDRVSKKRIGLFGMIKKDPLYKKSRRDKIARKLLENFKEKDAKLKSKRHIVPGQLVLFKYLNPKNQDELEYYDASPCTIFFNVIKTSQGKRVLGFNIHYFPPAIRYRILDLIYGMYSPVYSKYFETGLTKDMDAFDYKYLVEELDRHNLSFAVREYIPNLIGDTLVIPPKLWTTAIFTEGWFKKETRAAILQRFKEDAKSKKLLSTGTHAKGKVKK